MGLVRGAGTPRPDTEEAIALAREDYVAGVIELAAFEHAVECILDGSDRRYTSPFPRWRDPVKRVAM